MSVYYVDSIAGSNSNNGASTGSAWANMSPVWAGLNSGVIGRGDQILLKRGSVFYGALDKIPAIPNDGLPHLVFSAYGSGPLPYFSGYKIINSSAWVSAGTNLWQVDISANSGNYTGNVESSSANVGHLLVDGKIFGALKSSTSALTAQWDFYANETTSVLYVFSTNRPGNVSVAIKQNALRLERSVTVSQIDFEGYGGHGWSIGGGSTTVGSSNVFGCRFRKIGGSTLLEGSRFGNGGEVWIGSYDIRARGNFYEDVYDVAFTLQGGVSGAADGWDNVEHSFNTSINCTQTYEIWGTGSSARGFRNVKYHNNIGINGGFSWGSKYRPDTVGKANHLMTYDITIPTDVEIYNNIFFGVNQNYRYHRTITNGQPNYSIPVGYSSHDNYVFGSPDSLIQFQRSETFINSDAYVSSTSSEIGTKFYTIPDDIIEAASADSNGAISKILSFLSSNTALAEHSTQILNANVRSLEGEVGTLRASVASAMQNGLSGNALVSTWWYAPERTTGGTGTYQGSNQMIGQPWLVPASGAIDQIAVEVLTAGSAGSLVRAGIARLNSGGGFTTVYDAGTQSATTTGIKQFSLPSIHVRENELLWLVVVAQGNPGTNPVLRASTAKSDPNVGSNNLGFILQNPVGGFSLSGVTGSLPAVNAAGAVLGSTSTPPVMAVRAV